MTNPTSIPVTLLQREQAVAAAIASVRAEGLEPTKDTENLLNQYAEGKITADKLREVSLEEFKPAANSK